MSNYFDPAYQNVIINTSTTTVVIAQAAFLKRVNIMLGGAAASRVRIYDNASAASGTVLFDSNSTGPAPAGQFDLEVIAANGLTALTEGGTPVQIQVFYKSCKG